MKISAWLAAAVLLSTIPPLAQEAATRGQASAARIPLRVGLYISDAVPRSDELHIIQNVTAEFERTFASVTRLPQVSPGATTRDGLDCVIVVEKPKLGVTGIFTYTTKVSMPFSVYSPSGERIFQTTEEHTGKSEDTTAALWDSWTGLASAAIASFLEKFGQTDLVRKAVRPTPQPAAPEPPHTATLALTTQPANVQVYVDDVFKGMTSAEGRLVIEGLAPGAHRVRMNLIGYTESARTVELKAGETATIEAKLEPAGPKPLALAEIEEALTNGISPKRVTTLVNQYGVDFTLTKPIEQRLRDKGADSDLLVAIATNKK